MPLWTSSGRQPDDVGHHAHPLLQVDQRDAVGRTVGERRAGRLRPVLDDGSVHGGRPGGLTPVQRPTRLAAGGTVGAERPRVEDAPVAPQAPLHEETPFPGGVPERPALGADRGLQARAHGLSAAPGLLGSLGPCRRHSDGLGPEHGRRQHRKEHAGSVGHGHLGAVDLACVGLAPELAHRFGDQEHAVHAGMGEGEPAAVRVHGERASRTETDVGRERPALALGAEAEILQVEKGGDGEAVVAHEHVHLGGTEARHGEGTGARDRPRRRGEIGHLGDAHVVGAGRRAEDVDRRLGQGPRPCRAGHDEGAGPIGHQAAVEQVQRAHLQRRCEDVGDRQRVAVAGPRVQRGPLPGAHRNGGQLFGRRAELVHVAGGGQRVRTHREAEPEGELPLLHRVGPRHAAPWLPAFPCAITARRRGVDAHHHLAQSGGDGGGRVFEMDLVARATRHGRFHEGRVQPQVFGEGHGRFGVADAVDLVQREPGVLERPEHHGDLELAAGAVELPGRRHVVGHPDDGGRAAQGAVLPAHSPRSPRPIRTRPRTARRSWAVRRRGSRGRCWVPWAALTPVPR